MDSIKTVAGLVMGLACGGCGSVPLGSEEMVSSVQEEVALNAGDLRKAPSLGQLVGVLRMEEGS